MPARVMGTRGRDIGVSQGPEHHSEQGSSWVHHGTEVAVWWLRHGSRRRAGLHREANTGPPHGADVWLDDQTSKDGAYWCRCRQVLRNCLVPDMICRRVPGACRSLFCDWFCDCHWSTMQSGITLGTGFEKGFLIRKSTVKCMWEGVPDQERVPEMGFSAGFVIGKGFSLWVPDGVPNHVPKPPAPPDTQVCPCRSLLTSRPHWWLMSRRS